MLVEVFTVAENIILGSEITKNGVIPAAQAMDLPETSSGSSFLSLLSKFFSNNKTEEPEHASEENTELTERKLTGKTPKAEKIEESFDTAVVGSISAAVDRRARWAKI